MTLRILAVIFPVGPIRSDILGTGAAAPGQAMSDRARRTQHCDCPARMLDGRADHIRVDGLAGQADEAVHLSGADFHSDSERWVPAG